MSQLMLLILILQMSLKILTMYCIVIQVWKLMQTLQVCNQIISFQAWKLLHTEFLMNKVLLKLNLLLTISFTTSSQTLDQSSLQGGSESHDTLSSSQNYNGTETDSESLGSVDNFSRSDRSFPKEKLLLRSRSSR